MTIAGIVIPVVVGVIIGLVARLAVLPQIVSAAVAVALGALVVRSRRGPDAIARVPPIDRGPAWEPPARRAPAEPAPVQSWSEPGPVAEPVPGRTRIFLSYRRSDSRHAAARIGDALRDRFGESEVFVDVDEIDHGADFVASVLDAIRASAVVLVIIGDQWLGAPDQRRRHRIDDPDDAVRIEIEQALRSGCALLPVLLDGAVMPRRDQLPGSIEALHRRHALPVNHVSWPDDIARLIRAVDSRRG